MFMVSSLAVLRNRGEFLPQHTGEGEVNSSGRVLHHEERSIAVGNGATWVLSSGVEGVAGEGERESVVVREGEEGDMGEGEIKRISFALLSLGSTYLPASFKRRKTARFRQSHLVYQ